MNDEKYNCGCSASEGCPKYCPTHGVSPDEVAAWNRFDTIGQRAYDALTAQSAEQSSTPPATPEPHFYLGGEKCSECGGHFLDGNHFVDESSGHVSTNPPSPAGAATAEWLDNYDKPLRIRDGNHKRQICDALDAYSEHIVAPIRQERDEARERVGRLVRDNYKLTSERWKECCASEVFQELKHGKYRQVLNLLFDQQISVGKCAQSIAEISHGTTPLLPEEYEEIDLSKWPDCAVDGCRNKSCISLDSEHCHPHTKQFAAERELEASREEMKGLREELAALQKDV